MRFLSIPLVVIVLVAGLWLTGGVITNDFAVAMGLTAAWMGLAGGLCVVIATRSRALRWPVLGAYAVTAAVAGGYLGSSTLLDREVDERVAVAAPTPPPALAMAAERPEPRNVLVRSGRFEPVRHAARGKATVIDLARGGRVLTLTGFEVDNGPDLRVYLVRGPAASEGQVRDFVDLGALKGNRGDQQYEIPRGVHVSRYSTAVVWCRAFSVLFARAPTRA